LWSRREWNKEIKKIIHQELEKQCLPKDWVSSPILPLELKSKKPKCSRYPKEIVTVGDELRSVRLDRGLTQHQVAKMIDVNLNFIYEMELNHHTNTIYALHKAYLFLGYIPTTLKITSDLRGRLFKHRIKHGFTFNALSQKTRTDKSTIARFEKGENHKKETYRIIYNYLKNNQ
jgi:transcriptional regulator with XRE-family HTH domain